MGYGLPIPGGTWYVQLVIVIIIVMHIFNLRSVLYSILQYPKNYFLEYINTVKIMSVLL